MEILTRLGIKEPGVYEELGSWHCQTIENAVGIVTGNVGFRFRLWCVSQELWEEGGGGGAKSGQGLGVSYTT